MGVAHCASPPYNSVTCFSGEKEGGKDAFPVPGKSEAAHIGKLWCSP